jgi:excisionase family DNA binding protein
MSEEKLLTVRDVSITLGISEREVMDLAESGALPAYKVGGVYLRFKKEQVMEYQKSRKTSPSKEGATDDGHPLSEKISDFFYFNDFYILTGLLIILLLVVIFQGY